METVQQNGRFTLFSSKFPSNIFSILFAKHLLLGGHSSPPFPGRRFNQSLIYT